MRIIFLPYATGGQAAGLSKALRDLGHHSETWVREQDWLRYEADRVFVTSAPSQLWARVFRSELARFRMLRYLFDFEVVVYTYGSTVFCPHRSGFPGSSFLWPFTVLYNLYQSVMQLVELSLARILGRRIVVIFQGDDARRRRFSSNNFPVSFVRRVPRGYYSRMSDLVKVYQSKLFGIFAHQIYFVNPDLAHVLPRKARFMPYAHVFAEGVAPRAIRPKGSSRVLGHAPTSRAVKGTADVLRAVDLLRHKGLDFDFQLIEHLSNRQALATYESLDLFVDQLLAGWYGGVAVEVMALGVPVVAYIRDTDLRFVPPEMVRDLPIRSAEPSTIEDVLEDLLVLDHEGLVSLGQRSREFVVKWHEPRRVALQLLADLGIRHSD